MRKIAALIACLSLCGCESIVENYITQAAPAELTGADLCRINRHLIDVALPSDALPGAADARYGAMAREAVSETPGDILFLSGGSQHGAFGAGFLDGWKQRAGNLPAFRVVTGISTGALLSTGAFIDRPEISVAGYSIEQESDLLETYVSGDQLGDGLSIGVALTALRNGAIADLIPLRSRLAGVLTPDVFAQVAARANTGAKLFVGATDLDAGVAVAFDMTDLAQRYVAAASEDERAHVKDCYIEALVASSIVPPGARPNFIDNRMYIDGGAKFAVFAEDIGDQIADGPGLETPLGPPLRDVYLLINGDAEQSYSCGKADETLCRSDGPTLDLRGQHSDWTVPGMAGRALSILTNQVNRLSIDRAANLKRPGFRQPVFIRIDEALKDGYPSDLNGAFGGGTRSCADWRAEDDRIDNPLEFHPRYMRCLIDFGRDQALNTAWHPDG